MTFNSHSILASSWLWQFLTCSLAFDDLEGFQWYWLGVWGMPAVWNMSSIFLMIRLGLCHCSLHQRFKWQSAVFLFGGSKGSLSTAGNHSHIKAGGRMHVAHAVWSLEGDFKFKSWFYSPVCCYYHMARWPSRLASVGVFTSGGLNGYNFVPR